MRFLRRLPAFLALSVFAVAQQPPPAAPASFSIAKLAWLAGHWRLERSGRVVDEQWMAPAGGTMLGMARTVSKGKLIEYEFVQVREGPGGELFYIAQPSGQKEAAFKVVSLTDTEVVFENKEHDFPQVIGYGLQPDGSALAWIEGPGKDGKPKRIEYPYKKVAP
ncbi:MAG TPA: DUF6265 family protein [Lacunisphaera sp.]|nr:DUF6265 family protein [Lacunisphaera sp.]